MKVVREATLEDKGLTESLESAFPGANQRSVNEGLFQFESEIVETFQKAWNEQAIEEVCARYGFSSDEAFDIAIYYSVRIFSNMGGDSADPQAIFDRLKEISRERYIAENREIYNQIKASLGKFSVPEIAAELILTERQVYEYINNFGLSVERAFETPVSQQQREAFEQATFALLKKRLHPEGENALSLLRAFIFGGGTFDEMATIGQQIFGFGKQALQFVFHYQHSQYRGVSWDRSAEFEGQILQETEILIHLRNQGLDYREIADRLNSLFPPKGEDDFRTEGAVSTKLFALGETLYGRPLNGTVFVAEYGYLVRGGRFVAPLMIRYLIDHRTTNVESIASNLNFSAEKIRNFIKRHGLDQTLEQSTALGRAIKRYQLQNEVLEKTLDWIKDPKQGNGRTPEVGDLSKIMRHDFPLLLKKNIFANSTDFFVKLHKFGAAHGVQVSLLQLMNLKASESTPEYVELRRQEAFAKMFDAIQASHGEPPPRSQDPINFRNALRPGTGYIESYSDFWLAYKAYSRARGVDFQVFKADFKGESTEALRKEQQQELLEAVTVWIAAHNERIPENREMQRDLGIGMDRIVATGHYKAGEVNWERRIFESPLDFFLQLHAYAQARGVKVWILDVRSKEINGEVRALRQEEALDILAEWVRTHDNQLSLPKVYFPDPAPRLNWQRLTGTSSYAPGKDNYAYRIFDSTEHMHEELKKKLGAKCSDLL